MQKLPDEFIKIQGVEEGQEQRRIYGKRIWNDRKNPEEILAMHSVPIRALIFSVHLQLQNLSRHN